MRRPYDEARPDASPIDHLWRTSGLGLLLSRRAARGALKGPRRGAPQEIRDCAALERIPKDIPLDKSHVVVNDVRTARFDFANRFCESAPQSPFVFSNVASDISCPINPRSTLVVKRENVYRYGDLARRLKIP
jgi:hypothetical protein